MAHTKERNYGIDLLRITAMCYVVLKHYLHKGGIIFAIDAHSSSGVMCWIMYTITDTCVDIFALISGYAGYTDISQPLRPSKALYIWLETVYYGLLVAFTFSCLGIIAVSGSDLIAYAFPVANNKLWYTTAYIPLVFLMPLLNDAVRNLADSTLKKSLAALFLIFCVYSLITKDIFHLNNGFSVIWLMLMYIAGAALKKTRLLETISLKWILILSTISIAVPMLWGYSGIMPPPLFEGKELGWDALFVYHSPFIVILSIMHLALFIKFKPQDIVANIIRFATPCLYAVYITNATGPVYNHLVDGCTEFLSTFSPLPLLVSLFVMTIGYVVIVILLDKIRLLIFRLLRVNNLCSLVDRLAS